MKKEELVLAAVIVLSIFSTLVSIVNILKHPAISFKLFLIICALSVLFFVGWAIWQTLMVRKFRVMIRNMKSGNN